METSASRPKYTRRHWTPEDDDWLAVRFSMRNSETDKQLIREVAHMACRSEGAIRLRLRKMFPRTASNTKKK